MLRHVIGSAGLLTLLSAGVPAQQLKLASAAPDGTPGDSLSYLGIVSGDGSTIVFTSGASNLVPGDTIDLDVFARDMATGALERITVGATGEPADADSSATDLSADGRIVTFSSMATNLGPVPLPPGVVRSWVRDRDAGTTSLLGTGRGSSISADGRYVVVIDDVRVYRHDLLTGDVVHVSVSVSGGDPDGPCFLQTFDAISSDGRYVVFDSEASNLIPAVLSPKIRETYLRDLQAGVTTRLAVAADGQPADATSRNATLSGDGRFAGFISTATNLVPNVPPNFWGHIFVRNLTTGEVSRADVNSGGNGAGGIGPSSYFGLGADGRWLAFSSASKDLIPPGLPAPSAFHGGFVHDNVTGITWLTGTDPAGWTSIYTSESQSVSDDGRYADVSSVKLIPEDTNAAQDVYSWDRLSSTPWTELGGALAGTLGPPVLVGQGHAYSIPGLYLLVGLGRALPGAMTIFVAGASEIDVPFKGGTMVPQPLLLLPMIANAQGRVTLSFLWPAGLPLGASVTMQAWVADPGGPKGFAASNALRVAQN